MFQKILQYGVSLKFKQWFLSCFSCKYGLRKFNRRSAGLETLQKAHGCITNWTVGAGIIGSILYILLVYVIEKLAIILQYPY
jgi:hypothetical protein